MDITKSLFQRKAEATCQETKTTRQSEGVSGMWKAVSGAAADAKILLQQVSVATIQNDQLKRYL